MMKKVVYVASVAFCIFGVSMITHALMGDDRLSEGYEQLGVVSECIIDDVSLNTIVGDAQNYVADYYDATPEELGFLDVPVSVNMDSNNRLYDVDGNWVTGYVATGRITEEVKHIGIDLAGINASTCYPKHCTLWVLVHEYVHCARFFLGEHDDVRSEEEGETTLVTALIVQDVIGDDSDINWYIDTFQDDTKYVGWAEDAADRLGIEVPWDTNDGTDMINAPR